MTHDDRARYASDERARNRRAVWGLASALALGGALSCGGSDESAPGATQLPPRAPQMNTALLPIVIGNPLSGLGVTTSEQLDLAPISSSLPDTACRKCSFSNGLDRDDQKDSLGPL